MCLRVLQIYSILTLLLSTFRFIASIKLAFVGAHNCIVAHAHALKFDIVFLYNYCYNITSPARRFCPSNEKRVFGRMPLATDGHGSKSNVWPPGAFTFMMLSWLLWNGCVWTECDVTYSNIYHACCVQDARIISEGIPNEQGDAAHDGACG